MRSRQPHILLGWCILVASCALAAGACTDPLGTGEYLVQVVNIDSIVKNDQVFGTAPGDSIYANINHQQVVFATRVERPDYYNSYVEGKGYFITIQATRDGLDDGYEILSLRLDNIRDTGVYAINSSFSVPKSIDVSDTVVPQYGGSYSRKDLGKYPESFQQITQGEIHILKIDQELGVIIGTFWFIAYNPERGTEIRVDGGVFRIYIPKS